MTNKQVEEKLREEINIELGYISALFMSQGDTRAGDIVMPSTELQEALDRIMLYVFGYQKQALAKRDRDIVEMVEKEIAIHEQLAGEWTGIKIDGSQVNINPHREKADILSDIKALLTPKEV